MTPRIHCGLGGAATWSFARSLAAEALLQVRALLYSRDNDPESQSVLGAFWAGLFGWVEGCNFQDGLFAGGVPSLLAVCAAELVNLRPDVIFLRRPAAAPVRRRRSVIPIVFVAAAIWPELVW
jgi:hypothetical protein